MFKIRPGRPSDKTRVIELLRDSRAGAGFDCSTGPTGFVFPFDPVYAENLFLRYLRGNFCAVYDVDDVPQGVLLAHAYDYDFGPVRLAQERLWWIDPEHRGGMAAVRMLDAFEKWASEQGCQFALMAGMGDDPAVMKLYRRRGYRVAETHCLKAVA